MAGTSVLERTLRRTAVDPEADAGDPDLRSPVRFLWWLLWCQRSRAARGAMWGSLWMTLLALPPYLVAQAVDEGLEKKDYSALTAWVALILACGVANGLLGIARHRTMTLVRLDASVRMLALVDAKATRLGHLLGRHANTGEVLAIGASDVGPIAQTLTIAGPGVGAVVATVVVAALLLQVSVPLAVLILLGVPAVTVALGPLIAVQQRTESHYRDLDGQLTSRATDIASGLGVLAGLGNTRQIADDFESEVLQLRGRGFRVAAASSWVQAATASLPVLLLALVTWLAARLTAQGELSTGELLAVYGYVAVLVAPVSRAGGVRGRRVRAAAGVRRARPLAGPRGAATRDRHGHHRARQRRPRPPPEPHLPPPGLPDRRPQLRRRVHGRPCFATLTGTCTWRYRHRDRSGPPAGPGGAALGTHGTAHPGTAWTPAPDRVRSRASGGCRGHGPHRTTVAEKRWTA